MHLKNGRLATMNIPVIHRDPRTKIVNVGLLNDLQPGSDTCNATLQRVIGCPFLVNIKDCLHAEDATFDDCRDNADESPSGVGCANPPAPAPKALTPL